MTSDTVDRPIFVPTSIALAVEEAAYFALRYKRAAAVTGPAGIGKSTALLRLCDGNPKALYGEGRSFRTLKLLYRHLTSAFDISLYRERSIFSLREIMNERLPEIVKNGTFLLVDEMQELSIECLREIVGYAEDHRLPMVLVGNERALSPRLVQHNYTFDQILSRISKVRRLDKPVAEDYAEFVRHHGVTDTRAIEAFAAYGQRTSFRAVRDLLAVAADFTSSPAALDKAQLVSALFFITSDPDCVRLFNPPAAKAA